MRPEPLPVETAAARLGKAPGTIYSWASRYKVRKWRIPGGTLYDYADLATIDGCIHRGDEIPATPEARAALRESFRVAA